MQRIYVMAVLGVTLGLALAVGFVVLSLGIALLLLPVVAVFAAIGWWRWRKIVANLRSQAENAGDAAPPAGFKVIEADYEVVGPDERRRS